MKREYKKSYLAPQVEITLCESEDGLLAYSLSVHDKFSDPDQDVLCHEETFADFPWEEGGIENFTWGEE